MEPASAFVEAVSFNVLPDFSLTHVTAEAVSDVLMSACTSSRCLDGRKLHELEFFHDWDESCLPGDATGQRRRRLPRRRVRDDAIVGVLTANPEVTSAGHTQADLADAGRSDSRHGVDASGVCKI